MEDFSRNKCKLCGHVGFKNLDDPTLCPLCWVAEQKKKSMETKSQPHTCPVCHGNGIVANGFYTSTTGQWLSTDATPEQCRSCNGTGIVWSTETITIALKDD